MLSLTVHCEGLNGGVKKSARALLDRKDRTWEYLKGGRQKTAATVDG